MAAKFPEILEAYALAGFGNSGYGTVDVFLCRESGKLYWRYYEFSGLEQYNDELPADIEDEEKYIQLPDKKDLDLGVKLVMDVARQVLPQDADDISDMFRKRGAYSRFKQLLLRRGVLEQWYDFDQKATEVALRQWCEDNLVELSD